MVAGEIRSALNVPPTNLSFRLKALTQASLVTVVQEGRYQSYRAAAGETCPAYLARKQHATSSQLLRTEFGESRCDRIRVDSVQVLLNHGHALRKS